MSKKRTVAWYITLILIGLGCGLAIVFILRFINGPVASTVTLNHVAATPSPSAKPSNLLAGLTIELSYPGIFDEVGQVKNDAQAIEQYNLGSKGDYRRSIAISVRTLPSSSLADDSNYRYRQNNPTLYKETADKIGGAPIAIMTKLDHTEQTLFWAYKGRILTVAITSTNPHDDVTAYMAVIKPTVRWRQ